MSSFILPQPKQHWQTHTLKAHNAIWNIAFSLAEGDPPLTYLHVQGINIPVTVKEFLSILHVHGCNVTMKESDDEVKMFIHTILEAVI